MSVAIKLDKMSWVALLLQRGSVWKQFIWRCEKWRRLLAPYWRQRNRQYYSTKLQSQSSAVITIVILCCVNAVHLSQTYRIHHEFGLVFCKFNFFTLFTILLKVTWPIVYHIMQDSVLSFCKTTSAQCMLLFAFCTYLNYFTVDFDVDGDLNGANSGGTGSARQPRNFFAVPPKCEIWGRWGTLSYN